MNRPRLLDRYELLDELPHVTGGRLFRARDLVFAEFVGVKQLGAGCGLGPEERQTLEHAIRHLQCLTHPNLVSIHSFDPASGLLVHEWIRGLSLLDLLRRRRELTFGETQLLLGSLPGALDHLNKEAVPLPRPLLGKLYAHFEENVVPETLTTTPIDQWPPFILKLNPLSLRAFYATPSTDSTHTTIIDPREPHQIKDGYGPRELARLIYELLGGRIRELDTRRYSPLSALREKGNAVLRRTLLAMPPNDCESLWRELLDAQPTPGVRAPGAPFHPVAPPPPPPASTASTRLVHIPDSRLTQGQLGLKLWLDPVGNTAATPVLLTSGPQFAIGRSAGQSDFVAKVMPENEVNNSLTNRLSRVHALLSVSKGEIVARDGNGTGPSLNGSSLDGQLLVPHSPYPLTFRAVLRLGNEFALEIIPVVPPQTWQITNLADWAGTQLEAPALPTGALIFLPVDGLPVVRQSAWVFSEVGFGLDATEGLVWDTRGRGDSPAAFHHLHGCFWLRNRAMPDTALLLDDTAVQRDEIVPLVAGQILRIGSHPYTVRIE